MAEYLPTSTVLCDICEDRKLKALKFCLSCQRSYCETHLEPHLRVAGLKKHKLMDPVSNLEDYICQKHEKPLELFCRDDQTYVCLICSVKDHENHNTVPIEEKVEKKKTQKDLQQMIQDRIKKIQDIKQSAEVRKEEEKQRLKEDLEEAKDKACQRLLGNIKFTGELFKLKMLTESIIHDCIVKLLKKHDEESLECVCCLLSTTWKHLYYEKSKPRMDQYLNQMKKIIRDRKTSSRIRFMLQGVVDLQQANLSV